MKKLLLLLFIFPFVLGCSKDDNEKEEENNNNSKTSFAIRSEAGLINNATVFYKQDSQLIKIADIGVITLGIEKVISVDYNKVKEVCVHYHFTYDNTNWSVDTTFTLKKDIKNIFTIKEGTKHSKID